MMDYDKLIERLRGYCQEWEAYRREQYRRDLEDAAFAIETLRADLDRVTAELADLRAQWDMYGGDDGITAIYAELERVKAEMEGQYGIPPVKMHQKLFRVFNGEIYEETVCGAIWEPLMPRPRWKVFVMGGGCVYYWDDVLGKTVFLTRAEAEKALKAREQG